MILSERIHTMSALWPPELRHRAPPQFPPPWASAWGDDRYGLWADWVLSTPHGRARQRLRWIEPSQGHGFWMGSTQAERDQIKDKEVRRWAHEHEADPMQVRIAQGFWLADTPVTQALWHAVTGQNPSHFDQGPDAPQRPVEQVPLWADRGDGGGLSVLDFLYALQALLSAGHVATLPTELEWEYACRADTRSAYHWGDAFDPSRANAEHLGKKSWGSAQGTNPVKTYPANPWGLYDMHGNVLEWTVTPWQPRWSPSEAQAQAQDLTAFWTWASRARAQGAAGQDRGLARSGAAQQEAREADFAVRGGSWSYHFADARSAHRLGGLAGNRSLNLGLRFALRSSSTSPTAGLGPEGPA